MFDQINAPSTHICYSQVNGLPADESNHLFEGVLAQKLLTQSVVDLPVVHSQGRDEEVARNLGEDGQAVAGGHLKLLLHNAFIGSRDSCVRQLKKAPDGRIAVGQEAGSCGVAAGLVDHPGEVGAEGLKDKGMDGEAVSTTALQLDHLSVAFRLHLLE